MSVNFPSFPGTNLNDLNLDWLISKMKDLDEAFREWPHSPRIENGEWYVYDEETGEYQSTGVSATGPQGVPGQAAQGTFDSTEYNGESVSFNAPGALPFYKIGVALLPTQDGTPSVDNPAPLTTFSSFAICPSSKNIIRNSPITRNKYISSSGVETVSTTSDLSHCDYVEVEPNSFIYVRAYLTTPMPAAMSIAEYDVNKTFIRRYNALTPSNGVAGSNYKSSRLSANCHYIIVNFSYSVRNWIAVLTEDLNTALPSEISPTHGVYVDITGGKVYVYKYYASYNNEPLVGPWLSSKDVYSEGGSPTEGAEVVDIGEFSGVYDIDINIEYLTNEGENYMWPTRGVLEVTAGNYVEAVYNTLSARIDKLQALVLENMGG